MKFRWMSLGMTVSLVLMIAFVSAQDVQEQTQQSPEQQGTAELSHRGTPISFSARRSRGSCGDSRLRRFRCTFRGRTSPSSGSAATW